MGNYSDNSGMVKVDFYKASGKWYMTEAWDMSKYWDFCQDSVGRTGPVGAVEQMLSETERGRRLLGQFNIVVDEPYHRNGCPVMLVPEAWWRALCKEPE